MLFYHNTQISTTFVLAKHWKTCIKNYIFILFFIYYCTFLMILIKKFVFPNILHGYYCHYNGAHIHFLKNKFIT